MVASAQGLDVSNFQGMYDWAAAKARIPGLVFGIHRLTQGLGAPGTNSPDPTAVHNHRDIAATGLVRGAYHFLDPRLSGAAQAEYFVKMASSLGAILPTDMFWLDNEVSSGLSPANVAGCADQFMAELATLLPHNPIGAYSYLSFITGGYCHGLGHWPLWIADYQPTAPVSPPPWVKWTFWQWGQRTGVDADAFNGTVSAFRTWVAAYAPAPTPPPTGPPYRHAFGGHDSIATIAGRRSEPVKALMQHTSDALTTADESLVGAIVPPPGTPYYTIHP